MKSLVIIVSSNLSHGFFYSHHVYTKSCIYSHYTLSESECVVKLYISSLLHHHTLILFILPIISN